MSPTMAISTPEVIYLPDTSCTGKKTSPPQKRTPSGSNGKSDTHVPLEVPEPSEPPKRFPEKAKQ